MEATGYLIGGGRRSSFHSDTAFLFLPSMTQRGPGTRLSYQVAPRRPMQPPVGRCSRLSADAAACRPMQPLQPAEHPAARRRLRRRFSGLLDRQCHGQLSGQGISPQFSAVAPCGEVGSEPSLLRSVGDCAFKWRAHRLRSAAAATDVRHRAARWTAASASSTANA